MNKSFGKFLLGSAIVGGSMIPTKAMAANPSSEQPFELTGMFVIGCIFVAIYWGLFTYGMIKGFRQGNEEQREQEIEKALRWCRQNQEKSQNQKQR